MATVAARRVAAVVGYFVADAAVQPLHWVYNKEKLENLIGGKEEIAFWEPSANPYYCVPTGSQTPYGDQVFVILESLVENKGLNIPAMKKAHYDAFGPDAGFTETSENVPKSELPIKKAWRNISIKEFLKKYSAGEKETGHETDEYIDCTLRVIPVAALYAGRCDMLEKAEEVIRITQCSDIAVAVGLVSARLIEYYILHGRCEDAVEEVIRQLEDPKRANPQSLDNAMVSHLRKVLQFTSQDHRDVAKNFRIN